MAGDAGGGQPADAVLGLAGFRDAVEIGRGGFGVVYRARQPALARDVAIKILSAAGDESSARRFDRERQVLGALASHPAVVTVHDSGFTASGRPYLVMELMAGGSLGERLADSGPLSWTDACEIGVRIAGGLEAAHRLGVLHRDVKPDNILVSAYDDVKLADFGIAAVVEGGSSRTSNVTASIAHAAPEVLEGNKPTAAADVYGLASTVFALVYGHAAFRRPTDESVLPMMNRIFTEPVPDLRPMGVPAAMCEVLERGMAKRADDRYPSAELFAQALRDVQVEHAVVPTPLIVEATASAPLLVPDGAVASSMSATTGPEPVAMAESLADGRSPRQWRRIAPVAIVVALALLVVAVAAVALDGGDGGEIATRDGLGDRADGRRSAATTVSATVTTSPPTTVAVVDVPPTTVAPSVVAPSTTRSTRRPPSAAAPAPAPEPAQPPTALPPTEPEPLPTEPPAAPTPAQPPLPTAAITGASVYHVGLTGFLVGESSNATSGTWSLPGFNISDPTFEPPSDNFSISPTGGACQWYEATLTVRNAAGQTASDSHRFYISDGSCYP